jgi:SAM-dependent methyltransferase
MADPAAARRALRSGVVWAALRDVLAAQAAAGRTALDVLDAGGGTGGFAVPLAELGHSVTVVDPSPDSLAALERRAAEAGVAARVHAVQGDLDNLADVIAADGFDLVLCHSVLEHVDDPAAAVRSVAQALRPGGTASIVAANRIAAVFARALAGHIAEATRALQDPDGRYGGSDGLLRRTTTGELTSLVGDAGLHVQAVQGVRVFADLVPSALLDGDSNATDALVALEAAVAERPEFRDVATALHVLASRPAG